MPLDEFGLGEIGAVSAPSQLAYPGLTQLIVETALPSQVHRQLFVQYPTGGQFAFTVPLEKGKKTAVASRVGDGDDIPLDIAPLSSTTVRIFKIGRGHVIPREMVMFQQVPIIQQRLRRLGFVMGNTIDVDCANTMIAGRDTGNDVTATHETLGFDGTIFTVPNGIGQFDLIRAKRNIFAKNLYGDTLLLNEIGWESISRLPQYHAEFFYGQAVYRTGELGHLEGLRSLVSRNVGIDKVNADGTLNRRQAAYVVNSGLRATPLGQFTPMGYFGEALPITSMVRDAPQRDAYEVFAVAYYAPVVTLGEAVSEIRYNVSDETVS